jgi:hypothetical protein
VNPDVKWLLIAVLAAVAAGYFVVMVWRTGDLARVLLRRGYAERGYDEPGLTLRLRVLGWAGLVLSVAGLVVAIARVVG